MTKNIIPLFVFILANILFPGWAKAHNLTNISCLKYVLAIKEINENVKKMNFHVWQLRLDNGSLCNICLLKPNQSKYEIKSFVYDKTAPITDILMDNYGVLGVNGGYFNLNNGLSTSYVYDSTQVVVDPRNNPDLINNPNLKPFLNQIFKRSEIKCFLKSHKIIYDIEPALEEKFHDKNLIWSLQAGPQLLPVLRIKEEAFVRLNPSDKKMIDSIGTNLDKARSAVGITQKNEIFIVTVCSKLQEPQSIGCKLSTLSKIFKDLKCVKALNLDGGTSTSMVMIQNGSVVNLCLKSPPTKIKSGLIICPKAHLP